MQFTLNRKRWGLLFEPIRRKMPDGRSVVGECTSPSDKPRFIRIDSRLEGEYLLDALLHELLHCAAWDVLDEEFVTTTATGIARLLHRLGYRKLSAEQIKQLEAD